MSSKRNQNGQFFKTHGMSRTREYYTWVHMLERCYNPKRSNYSNYGGRGITVCEKWQSFEGFFEDMGYKPQCTSIERIDNDGPYSPENCRWATRKEQSFNRRTNKFYRYCDENKTLVQWAETLKIPLNTLRNRIRRGWSIKRAFTTPRRNYPEAA